MVDAFTEGNQHRPLSSLTKGASSPESRFTPVPWIYVLCSDGYEQMNNYRASARTSARCTARLPVPCAICCRQDTPWLTTWNSPSCDLIAGNNDNSPTAIDVSKCSFSNPKEPAIPQQPDCISIASHSGILRSSSIVWSIPTRAF